MLLATLLGVATSAIGCDCVDRTTRGEPDSESLPKLSAELGLSFPRSTRLIGVKRYNGMDDAVLIKLEITNSEFPSFMAETRIDPASVRPGTGGLLGQDEGFWNPHQAPSLRTGQTSRPGARVLNVGFDDNRADIVAVYLMEHGT